MNASTFSPSGTGCSLRPFTSDVRLAPVFIFNIPSRKLMCWIVGDISSDAIQHNVELNEEDYLKRANPFRSITFIFFFVCGILLAVLVPLSLSMSYYVRRRKQFFNVSNASVILPAMDIALMVACVLLCLFGTVIIWNNDMLTPYLSRRHTSLTKRLEDHEEMLKCQISASLVLATTHVYSQTEDVPPILKKAFTNTANAFLSQQFIFFNNWRKTALRLLKSVKTNDSSLRNDVGQLNKIFSEPVLPDTLLGDPVYVKKDNQKEQSHFSKRFLKAASEVIRDIWHYLEDFQQFSHTTTYKVRSYAFYLLLNLCLYRSKTC